MQTLYSQFRRINLLPEATKFKPCLFPFSSLAKTRNPDGSFLGKYPIDLPFVDFFKSLGFSKALICSIVRAAPYLLEDCDDLKPKIDFFQQELGLVGSDLGKFLSKNSELLNANLEEDLIPAIEVLRKVLVDDKNNEVLLSVITRNKYIFFPRSSRLVSNVEYLETLGIACSQLSMLLKTNPRFLTMEESKLSELVSRTLSFGFSINSRMFVHALQIVRSSTENTLESKFQVFTSFGFSKDESMDLCRRTPKLLSLSKKNLERGLEYFLNTMVIMVMKREVLFQNPACLQYSLEGRVVPRYEVLLVVMSKGLLKREPKFQTVLRLTEEKFLAQYVEKFEDCVEELLKVYKDNKGRKLDCSSASSEKDYEETES